MRRHTRAQTYEARLRNERRVTRIIDMVNTRLGTSQDAIKWTMERGRMNKFTMSCDDHWICRNDRAERKFRTHRRDFYKARDVADFEHEVKWVTTMMTVPFIDADDFPEVLLWFAADWTADEQETWYDYHDYYAVDPMCTGFAFWQVARQKNPSLGEPAACDTIAPGSYARARRR